MKNENSRLNSNRILLLIFMCYTPIITLTILLGRKFNLSGDYLVWTSIAGFILSTALLVLILRSKTLMKSISEKDDQEDEYVNLKYYRNVREDNNLEKILKLVFIGGPVLFLTGLGIFFIFQSKPVDLTPSKPTEEIDSLSYIIKPRKSDRYRKQVDARLNDKEPAFALASLDAGHVLRKDHPSIPKYENLLKTLSIKYVENKEGIGDMTVVAQEILKESGIKENLITIMEDMNSILESKSTDQKYSIHISTYVLMRKNGNSRLEVLLAMDAILKGYDIE